MTAEMKALMGDNTEQIEACLGVMKASLKTMEANQEQMKAD
jgi:argininosuccinate lyase